MTTTRVHMAPAEYIVNLFGTLRAIADPLGLHRSTVLRWSYPTAQGGLDGQIPIRYHAPIVELAKAKGLVLSDVALIRGGTAFVKPRRLTRGGERWARRTVKIQGKRQSLGKWGRHPECAVSPSTFMARVRNGWTPELAFTKRLRRKKRTVKA